MARLRLFVIAVCVVCGLGPAVAAANWVDYSPQHFADAQEAGRTILVDVAADWCPVCKAQHPILEELAAEDGLQDVLFVRVDFDTHKDFLRTHRVPRQSTIMVFHGETEIARSIAETDRERLRAFVLEAVQR